MQRGTIFKRQMSEYHRLFRLMPEYRRFRADVMLDFRT
jgi:hypothetical protein